MVQKGIKHAYSVDPLPWRVHTGSYERFGELKAKMDKRFDETNARIDKIIDSLNALAKRQEIDEEERLVMGL